MDEFVTADPHFGDLGMLGAGFITRPFRNVDEMNAALIENWNATVPAGATVYVLGDVFSEKTWRQRRVRIFNALNGRKVLLRGNHDTRETQRLPWVEIRDRMMIERGGVTFSMRHYPPQPQLQEPGVIYLHGHIHSITTTMPVYDVGVDAHDFKPTPMSELVAKAQAYQRGFAALAALQQEM